MSLARFVAAAALAFAVSSGAAATQLNSDGSLTRFDATLYRLGIKLPPRVVDSAAVNSALDVLTREKCDQSGIADLGKALDAAGYRREASTALVSFSDNCGGHAPSLRSAVNILMGLTDYAAARRVASMLIKLEPFSDNGYFLRALAAEPGETMQMHTANGVVEARRARAKSVQLRSLRAADVLVAIQSDKPTPFGPGIDGLLGMSFLARFKLTIDSVNLTIAP